MRKTLYMNINICKDNVKKRKRIIFIKVIYVTIDICIHEINVASPLQFMEFLVFVMKIWQYFTLYKD